MTTKREMESFSLERGTKWCGTSARRSNRVVKRKVDGSLFSRIGKKLMEFNDQMLLNFYENDLVLWANIMYECGRNCKNS
jgi:hypothetical protein